MKTKLLKKVRKNVWIEYSSVDRKYRIYVISRITKLRIMYDYCFEKEDAFRSYRNAVRWYLRIYFFKNKKKKYTTIQIKHAEK